MAFEEHIAQKCRLAVAMAVIKTKPPDLPTELYLLQLQRKALSSVPEVQLMDLDQISISSMDFAPDCTDSPNTIEDSASTQIDLGIMINCRRQKNVATVTNFENETPIEISMKDVTKKAKRKIIKKTNNENIRAKKSLLTNNEKSSRMPTDTCKFSPFGHNQLATEKMEQSLQPSPSVPQKTHPQTILRHDYSQKYHLDLTENNIVNEPITHNLRKRHTNEMPQNCNRIDLNDLSQNSTLGPTPTVDRANSNGQVEHPTRKFHTQEAEQLETQYDDPHDHIQKEKVEMEKNDTELAFQRNYSLTLYESDNQTNAVQKTLNYDANNEGEYTEATQEITEYFQENPSNIQSALQNTDLIPHKTGPLTPNTGTLSQTGQTQYEETYEESLRQTRNPETLYSQSIQYDMLEEISQVLKETEAMDCDVPKELIGGDSFVTTTEKGTSFKVLLELNKVKNFLSNNDYKKTNTYDSGYKSESQVSASQQSVRTASQPSGAWLDQAASTLIEHICCCALNSTHHQVTLEVSSTLGALVDALHRRERYPAFLDALLGRADGLLEEVCGDRSGTAGRDTLLKKDESTQRLLLLCQSAQLAGHAVERLLRRLEALHEQLCPGAAEQRVPDGGARLEGECYTFHLLETLLAVYLSKQRVEDATEEHDEDPTPAPSSLPSTISQVWLKRWDPDYKPPRPEEARTKEKKDIIDRCGNVLNKLIVSCMDKYSLISYAALECFNSLQP